MEIKWSNLIAFAMLLAAIVISLTMGEQIVAVFRSMGDLRPGSADEEQTVGLIAVGLVALLIAAVVKTLFSCGHNGTRGSESDRGDGT